MCSILNVKPSQVLIALANYTKQMFKVKVPGARIAIFYSFCNFSATSLCGAYVYLFLHEHQCYKYFKRLTFECQVKLTHIHWKVYTKCYWNADLYWIYSGWMRGLLRLFSLFLLFWTRLNNSLAFGIFNVFQRDSIYRN